MATLAEPLAAGLVSKTLVITSHVREIELNAILTEQLHFPVQSTKTISDVQLRDLMVNYHTLVVVGDDAWAKVCGCASTAIANAYVIVAGHTIKLINVSDMLVQVANPLKLANHVTYSVGHANR